MKTRILGVILMVALSYSVFGQYEDPNKNPETETKKKEGINLDSKWFFGGNLGMSFGTYSSYVEIAPTVGYKLSKWFWPGAGPMYIYQKLTFLNEQDKLSIYGVKTFAYINLLNNLEDYLPINLGSVFAYTEDQFINVNLKATLGDGSIYQENNFANVFLVGGGLRFPFGKRGGLSVFCMWDLSQSIYYHYDNPVIRIGFDF